MKDFFDISRQEAFLLLQMLAIVLITLLVYYSFNHFIGKVIQRQMRKDSFNSTSAKFLQRIVRVLIVFMGLAFIILTIPDLRSIATTVLAGAGLLVAVIGFASQQVLSNFISGIMIVFTKPYRLNDMVSVRGNDGVVEDVTLRHTVIRNFKNRRVIIPNSIMSNEVIVNSNFAEDICCEWIEIDISYTTDISNAKQIMKEEVIKHELFVDHRPMLGKSKDDDIAPIRVITVGQSSITLRAWAWAANPGNAFELKCELLEIIKNRFDKEGIEIPYPYSNILFKAKDELNALNKTSRENQIK
mgnify:CR=1 FL=1